MSMNSTLASQTILFAFLSGLGRPDDAKAPASSGFQRVTSGGGTFEYLIPSHWTRSSSNAYGGEDWRALEQIYPRAEVTAEYCRSFVTGGSEGYRTTVVENRLYHNGQVRGCFVVKDVVNTRLKRTWRHITFRFPTRLGVQDLTIVAPKEGYDEARVKTIVDSIQIK